MTHEKHHESTNSWEPDVSGKKSRTDPVNRDNNLPDFKYGPDPPTISTPTLPSPFPSLGQSFDIKAFEIESE